MAEEEPAGGRSEAAKKEGRSSPPAKSFLPKLGGGEKIKAAGGLALGAGAAAGAGVVNAIADPGFILFIAGLLSFLLVEYLGITALSLIVGTVFLFYSSVFIFKARGLVLTIIFWVWYFFLGGVLDPKTLLYSLLPLVLLAMAVHGLFSRFAGEGSFGQGAAGELIGLVPIVFFFLDLGLIPWLTQPPVNLPLTPLVQNLILFMPWWALLGLFTTRKESLLINAAKFACIIYLIMILTVGVVPNAYASYQERAPGVEQFLEAKEKVEGEFAGKKNPMIYWYYCFKTGRFAEMNQCMAEREEEDRLKQFCREEGYSEGTTEFGGCIEEQRKKAKQIVVTGIQDPTIDKPTKLEFIKPADFPTPYYVVEGSSDQVNYPIEMKITNPRKLSLEIIPSCYFNQTDGNVKGKLLGLAGGESLLVVPEGSLGFILPPGSQVISQSGNEASTTLVCQPEGELKGSYLLVYEAEIKNMMTVSRLQRVFIGEDKTADWKKENVPELKSTYFPGQMNRPQAPADFARLNFEFGLPTANPIIDQSGGLVLSSTIENAGKGVITKIHSYRIDLPPEFSIEDARCREGYDLPLPKTKQPLKNVYSRTCLIQSLPPELADPGSAVGQEFVYAEFEGYLYYDYLIKKEIPVKVEVITS